MPSAVDTDLVMLVGGVAVYGGARLAGSLLGYSFEGAAYLELLDAFLECDTAPGRCGVDRPLRDAQMGAPSGASVLVGRSQRRLRTMET